MRGEVKSLQGMYQKVRKLNYPLSAASGTSLAHASLTLCNISRASVHSSRIFCLRLSTSIATEARA
jgi:hypothetical protein